MSRYRFEEISAEVALGLWRETLWKDRKDPIEPMSAMSFAGPIDASIFEKFKASFFGAFDESGALVGVNSGHLSNELEYRSRGLFVHETHRARGLGQRLLLSAEEQARKEGAKLLWSYPKILAWPTYRSSGFSATDRRLKNTDLNVYAFKQL